MIRPEPWQLVEVQTRYDSYEDIVLVDDLGDMFLAYPTIISDYADDLDRHFSIKANLNEHGTSFFIKILEPFRVSPVCISAIYGFINQEAVAEAVLRGQNRLLPKLMRKAA